MIAFVRKSPRFWAAEEQPDELAPVTDESLANAGDTAKGRNEQGQLAQCVDQDAHRSVDRDGGGQVRGHGFAVVEEARTKRFDLGLSAYGLRRMAFAVRDLDSGANRIDRRAAMQARTIVSSVTVSRNNAAPFR